MNQNFEACPIELSDKLGREFFNISSENKATLGQYFTPFEVANYMASLLVPVKKTKVLILDPGAGSGILSIAAVKSLVERADSITKHFHIDLFEIDSSLIEKLSSSLKHLKTWCANRNIKLTFEIVSEDFILSNSSAISEQQSLIQSVSEYDIVISNPPYFKIGKDDPRALACASIVYGQPNIYALFMAVSAALLNEDGQLLFITPRSFASGQYFKSFRQYFFSQIAIGQIHQFVSRVDAFERDSVLQENIILFGFKKKSTTTSPITITSSQGRSDINDSSTLRVKEFEILEKNNDFALSLPSTKQDMHVLKIIKSWKNSLELMGLKISTGPVVPFRATEFLMKDKVQGVVPLYWIQHIKPMQTLFPLPAFRKQQWFKDNKQSKKLLVKNQNMILMRRFSPKEDFRRLTVAPFLSSGYKGSFVGLENHLNYIYRPNGKFAESEIMGLSAFLNSRFFDSYFRILNGNTQVSATELRAAPLPPQEKLIEIGTTLIKAKDYSYQAIDTVVEEILELDGY
ncbi:MAG: Eco57I restriction-modification methylase domain-containing protein [Oligoflexia bacterium]|nr:Eco57I restriction-modification methylase domain-containing protein [Oligoflexia bacterium]